MKLADDREVPVILNRVVHRSGCDDLLVFIHHRDMEGHFSPAGRFEDVEKFMTPRLFDLHFAVFLIDIDSHRSDATGIRLLEIPSDCRIRSVRIRAFL